MDFTAVQDMLLSVEEVEALHSLHIWVLTVAQSVLSVHTTITQKADAQAVLKAASTRLQGKFHFHTINTIQIVAYSDHGHERLLCMPGLLRLTAWPGVNWSMDRTWKWRG